MYWLLHVRVVGLKSSYKEVLEKPLLCEHYSDLTSPTSNQMQDFCISHFQKILFRTLVFIVFNPSFQLWDEIGHVNLLLVCVTLRDSQFYHLAWYSKSSASFSIHVNSMGDFSLLHVTCKCTLRLLTIFFFSRIWKSMYFLAIRRMV